MSTTTKTLVRTLLAPSLLLVGALLAGCSDDSSAADDAPGGDGSGGGRFDQALAYAECMRENGVPDFPDPQQDSGGVRLGGPGMNPDDPGFQEAEKACRDKAPQGMNGGGEPLDAAKVAEWAECIRANGLPEFPDPEIEGSSMTIDATGFDMQDGKFEEARSACQDKYPGGGMMVKGRPQ